MGEHGLYFTHGEDVFQATLHVPLIIKPPGSGREGVRIADPVSLVDLLPTVLELAHLDVPAGLDGSTLAPLLRGGPRERRDVFAEGGRHESSFYMALVEGGRKTVLRSDAGGGEMLRTYDLVADPMEQLGEPAAGATVDRLRARQAAWAELRLPFPPKHNFMPLALRGDFVRMRINPRVREDAARLRSLGYVH